MKKNYIIIGLAILASIVVGIGLFLLLGIYCTIPSPIDGKSIVLQYAVLAAISAFFGPVSGLVIGFAGHFLISLIINSAPYWSYIIGSSVFGLVMGCSVFLLKLNKKPFGATTILWFNLYQICTYALVCFGINPLFDKIIYNYSYADIIGNSVHSFVANSTVTLVLGTLILFAISKCLSPKAKTQSKAKTKKAKSAPKTSKAKSNK